MKISLLQLNPVADITANIATFERLGAEAIAIDRPDMIVMPENWDWAGGSRADKRRECDDAPGGRCYKAAQAFARRHGVVVHAGSIGEKAPDGKVFNVTYAFDREGRELARYAKIHLFDIVTPDGTLYEESATVAPGRAIVTYQAEGLTVGCTICYDLRFPELFQQLMQRGADIIMVPAAFTMQTGKDHWDVLLRARAIETEAYVVAAAQCGFQVSDSGEKRPTYGHSLIADPWGHVIARASDGVGFTTARIDRDYIRKCRAQIPLERHKVIGTDKMPIG